MPTVIGGPVRSHVQACANALALEGSISHISTYGDHDPARDLALDVFPTSKAEGDKLAAWVTRPDVVAHYGVDYAMWWWAICNPGEHGYHWRAVPDRGSRTQNHEDHIHLSFYTTASAISDDISEEDDELTGEEKAQLRYCKDAVDEIKAMLVGLSDGDEGGADPWENGRRRFVMMMRAFDERTEAILAKIDQPRRPHGS